MGDLKKLPREKFRWTVSVEELLYNLILAVRGWSGGSTTPSSALTDAQLRATPVGVSGPLTDAQIRATPLAVTGPLTDAQLRALALPVSGPLTNAQLRAAAVPVSLPTGAHVLTSVSVAASGNVTAGAFSVSFLPSSDFDGTIDGIAYLGSEWQVIPFQASEGKTLPAIAYTRTAGTLKIIKVV